MVKKCCISTKTGCVIIGALYSFAGLSLFYFTLVMLPFEQIARLNLGDLTCELSIRFLKSSFSSFIGKILNFVYRVYIALTACMSILYLVLSKRLSYDLWRNYGKLDNKLN